MLKRRHFSVDTSSLYREAQVSTPASGRQNGVFPALGRRNTASPAAPAASTLQNSLGTRSVDAEVSTPSSQAARQTLPADKRLRRSHIWGRETSDHYVEPTWVSIRLFEVEDFDRSQVLLDPCAGFGRIAEAAKAAGYTVIAADIVDRGYPGCLVQDFLDRKSAPPTVVGNPPFNAVEAFARHALELGARNVALLFPVARLNAARWLKELSLRRIWLLTPRPSMPPGYVIARGEKPGGGQTDFAWLIFERGYIGKAEVDWLHRDGDK